MDEYLVAPVGLRIGGQGTGLNWAAKTILPYIHIMVAQTKCFNSSPVKRHDSLRIEAPSGDAVASEPDIL